MMNNKFGKHPAPIRIFRPKVPKATMNELQQATPQVKKNIFLIRLLLAVILLCFAFVFLQNHPDQKNVVIAYALVLVATFIPFYTLNERVFEKVRLQFILFLMDLSFLLVGLYFFDHFETNLLIVTFLTLFISALSQSVGRSILVAITVNGMYLYLIYYKSDVFNYMDPILLLSCS